MMRKIVCLAFLFSAFAISGQENSVNLHNLKANTEVSDFGISFYGSDEVVFASSRRKRSIDKRIWQPNKQPYLELFKAKISKDGELLDIVKFSDVINTKYHESNPVFTKDLKTVYFNRNNYLNKKFKKDSKGRNLIQLYKAEVGVNGEWTNIQAMPFNSDEYQTGHPSLNAAEDKLYFISDMPGTLGRTDIFVVDINEDGTYGDPINLGPNVNTEKREMFPFLHNNEVLYYASDGFEDTLGGLDIYSISVEDSLNENGRIHLESPFNSDKDDFALVIRSEDEGYFSSNRSGGKGDDDIYYFNGYEAPSFRCEQLVRGVVRNKETRAPLAEATVKLFNEGMNVLEVYVTNERGEFVFNIQCETSYNTTAEKAAFEPSGKTFVAGKIKNEIVEIEITLTPSEFIAKDTKLLVNIGPIYFDLDSDKIRDDAARELDKVLKIMLKYPELRIDLGSHTDSRAPDKYNLELSERRAKSTMTWLIEKGISSERLSGKGYGETELVNKCANGVKCSDIEHQKNRRTEFRIVNPEILK